MKKKNIGAAACGFSDGELKSYYARLEKVAARFKLSRQDLSNLLDLTFMCGDDTIGTLKLNGMYPWFCDFSNRVMKAVISCDDYEIKKVVKEWTKWQKSSIGDISKSKRSATSKRKVSK